MGLGFRVLGPVEAMAGDIVLPTDGERPRVVLAGLLTHPGQRVTIAQLTRWLWEDDGPRNARAAIQTYVSRLRRALGAADVVRTERGGYRLAVADDAVDLTRFRDAAGRGWAAAGRGEHSEAVSAFEAALGEWSGEPLANVESEVLRRDVVSALREEALAVREARADALLALGQSRRLVAELTELSAGHPLRERVHEQLMVALYREGRQADALAVFDRVRGALDQELGLVPGPGLRAVRQAVITADPALEPGVSGESDVPRQLPADVRGFTARDRELARLRALPPGAVAVLEGTAGVGKSALAVHFAHQVAGDFPDGQLFLDLAGFGPVAPADPAVLLTRLLWAIGVPGEEVPAALDDRAALWRSRTTGRRFLVVLDDARDSAQVRPLLPGSGCLVLVTSRRRLGGLITRHGAKPITLRRFGRRDGGALLGGLLTDAVALPGTAAWTRALELCAGLPLAIHILGERVNRQAGRSLEQVVAEFDEEAALRAFTLDDGEESDMRALFAYSYAALPGPVARLFRLLGLHPAGGVSVRSAAALAAVDVPEGRRLLQQLGVAHLVEQRRPGRWELHDLLRDLAAELVAADGEAEAATTRLLEWYAASAVNAFDALRPYIAPEGADGPAVERFDRPDDSVAWVLAEQAGFVQAIAKAYETGLDRQAWQIARPMAHVLLMCGEYALLIETHRTGLAAATRSDDRVGEAWMRNGLGLALRCNGELESALAEFESALVAWRALSSVSGESMCLFNLATAYTALDRHTEALDVAHRALELAPRSGNPINVAAANGVLGDILLNLDRPVEALVYAERALAICEEAEANWEIGEARHGHGRALLGVGRYAEAERSLDAAVQIARELGSSALECGALCDLTRACLLLGDVERAQSLRAELDALVEGNPVVAVDYERHFGQLAALEI
ncbi:BTAD domain-containing putative transcriptional regulator [Amycolatopsis sp. NPDC051371]|uniref:AfsR/SARP family transcriptional regulator n=1 Tax=Amycolatopsis sp. NPDC051371 TaxID=3155800 RepID=UPI00341CB880